MKLLLKYENIFITIAIIYFKQLKMLLKYIVSSEIIDLGGYKTEWNRFLMSIIKFILSIINFYLYLKISKNIYIFNVIIIKRSLMKTFYVGIDFSRY